MEKNPIDLLMEHLAQDLVELENSNTEEKVINLITDTYQKIYDELIEIRKD